jgi:hypothetical protein
MATIAVLIVVQDIMVMAATIFLATHVHQENIRLTQGLDQFPLAYLAQQELTRIIPDPRPAAVVQQGNRRMWEPNPALLVRLATISLEAVPVRASRVRPGSTPGGFMVSPPAIHIAPAVQQGKHRTPAPKTATIVLSATTRRGPATVRAPRAQPGSTLGVFMVFQTPAGLIAVHAVLVMCRLRDQDSARYATPGLKP